MTSLLLSILLVLLPVHMEDEAGCFGIPVPDKSQLKERTVSPDGRDYIKRYDIRGLGHIDMEEHYMIAPKDMWENGKPLYAKNRLSVWLDTDEFVGWDHLYIDPRWQGQCKDYIHLLFDKNLGVWRLWTPHHDDEKA